MRIAACQMDAAPASPFDRLAAIGSAALRAKSEGVDIVVFPELATTGYGARDAIRAHAEPANGPTVERLKAIARENDLALVCGFPFAEDGAVFNASAFIAPNGDATIYRKIQLYGDYEKDLFSPGCAVSPIIVFRGLKIGLLVCFDVEFPERVRDLAKRGADIALVATALPRSDAGRFIATQVLPVRAFENQLFVVYANHAGKDERFSYQGLSCIAAPDGSLLAQACDDATDFIVADIDTGAYEASRAQNPYLAELMAARVTC